MFQPGKQFLSSRLSLFHMLCVLARGSKLISGGESLDNVLQVRLQLGRLL